jgi:hypothetical protein
MKRALIVTMLLVMLSGCDQIVAMFKPRPEIKFAPYAETYSSKMDFAEVEHRFPIPAKELERITPEYLATLDQEQLDQIYARLTAGPIPDGPFDGKIQFPKGSSGKFRAAEILGGLSGLTAQLGVRKLDMAGETLWKGKVFYRDQRVLRNRIDDLAILKPIIDNPASLQKISVDGRDAWLLFPAKLYCGQSLLDGRRESIIIDYAFSDDLPGYHERPDFLAGRRGLQVRDEIRMIRPGFYLGRAYTDRAFLLNFTLYNKALDNAGREAFRAGQTPEDCWSGTQQHVVAKAE